MRGRIRTSVPIRHGNSGAALVNDEGRVVGMLVTEKEGPSSDDPPQGVAVSAVQLRTVLPHPPALPPAADRAAAIERARRAVCQIEVYEGE